MPNPDRRLLMRNLIRMSEELGLYDLKPEDLAPDGVGKMEPWERWRSVAELYERAMDDLRISLTSDQALTKQDVYDTLTAVLDEGRKRMADRGE